MSFMINFKSQLLLLLLLSFINKSEYPVYDTILEIYTTINYTCTCDFFNTEGSNMKIDL